MKNRNLALLLAGVLSLGLLAGCAPQDKPEVSPSSEVTVTPSAEVSATPEVTATPEATETPESTATPEVTAAPSEKPSEKPVATPKPTVKPSEKPVATPKPTPKPSEKPAPAAVKVADLWTKISDGLADALPAGMEPGGDTLSDLYGISTADLDEYYFRMPMMSAHVTEFFIAKVKSGKMDTIKAACAKRQGDLAGGFLYPDNISLVESYQLVTNGDYILFCITEKADKAVEIFNGAFAIK